MTGKAPGGTSRKFGGVRAEVSGRGPRLLRSCLSVEISRRKPSEANFSEVRLGTPQTSKKSLQKRFHGEAGPSTVLKKCQYTDSIAFWSFGKGFCFRKVHCLDSRDSRIRPFSRDSRDFWDSKDQISEKTRSRNDLFPCSFCHLDFVKEFPRFGRKISAKIGESRQKSAKHRPKFD